VIDPAVRSTSQLPPSKFSFANPAFVRAVDQLVQQRVAPGLGCTEAQRPHIVAELYKLLLYVPGDHFVSHVDTSKSDGMFGTLVVQLPSQFTGGELVVRHAGAPERRI
jgi:hypothetical protein